MRVDLVDSYPQANEVEQAAATLRQVFELAVGIASVRPTARIGELARRLEPYRSTAEVADVLELVSSAT